MPTAFHPLRKHPTLSIGTIPCCLISTVACNHLLCWLRNLSLLLPAALRSQCPSAALMTRPASGRLAALGERCWTWQRRRPSRVCTCGVSGGRNTARGSDPIGVQRPGPPTLAHVAKPYAERHPHVSHWTYATRWPTAVDPANLGIHIIHAPHHFVQVAVPAVATSARHR